MLLVTRIAQRKRHFYLDATKITLSRAEDTGRMPLTEVHHADEQFVDLGALECLSTILRRLMSIWKWLGAGALCLVLALVFWRPLDVLFAFPPAMPEAQARALVLNAAAGRPGDVL